MSERDMGVVDVGDTSFLWEFEGTPEEHTALLAAIAEAAADGGA